MKKKLALWQAIKDNVESEIRVMLLYVLESSGSSPGRQGFGMMVTQSGTMQGSIGGGIMEHKLVEMAKEKLRHAITTSPQIRQQLHNKSSAKNQSGMICSGEQTVLMYEVQRGDVAAIITIINCLKELCTCCLQLLPKGIQATNEAAEQTYGYYYKTDEDWTYQEVVGYQNHLYIIGAGHCALALSRLMSNMDFYIHLYDDRNELYTMEQNNFVHEKHIVDDYSKLGTLIPSGKNSYVVIMTFGYRTDDVALRTLMGNDFKYLGVLGSATKIEKMFAVYRGEGVPEVVLKKIHAPVGLLIKSESPEEIAISIAAQIIKVKNERTI